MSKKQERELRCRIGAGLTAVMLGFASAAAAAPAPNALPTDGTVAGGAANITSEGGTMNIVQTTDKAIINWGSFHVGRDATVNFYQPNMAASTLNRVSAAGGLSEIYGHINSVGSILLINPNGILFGAGSEVNAAGIIASTANISDANYNAGNMIFEQNKNQNASIIVNGMLNVAPGGAYLDSMPNKPAAQTVLNVKDVREATDFAIGTHGIRLVADGDIAVGESGVLKTPQEVLKKKADATKTLGEEQFSTENKETTVRESSIVLRADQNADDVALVDENVTVAAGTTYGDPTKYDSTSRGVTGEADSFKTAKVYLNNNTQIETQNFSLYYDADIVNGVNGTDASAVGTAGSRVSKFTQKDATRYAAELASYKARVRQDKTIRQTYAMLVNSPLQLQAIQDTAAISAEKGISDTGYYGNLAGSYALGTGMNLADTANWNGGKGFDPIGSETNPFTGRFTGSGGSNAYGIYDLSIRRADKDKVGLFSSLSGASIRGASIIDANIQGHDGVGSFAGFAKDTSFDGVIAKKRNPDTGAPKKNPKDNVYGRLRVGGLVGAIENSSVIYSANESQVKGTALIGGIAGAASGTSISSSRNAAYIEGGDKVGGLAGALSNAASINGSYNNGAVLGTDRVGGLSGSVESGSKIEKSYNTNEGAALNTIIQADAIGQGTSGYGKVTGKTDVGGIAGALEDGTIDTVYNAGNIEGTKNVGGLVGSMKGGSTLKKAYNGDNNTVLKTSTDDASYYGFSSTNGHRYGYDNKTQEWVKDDGTRLSTKQVLREAPESTRTYNNRLAYRDATVKGSENVGGAVGALAGGTIDQTYSVGKVTGTGSAVNVGGYGGEKTGGTVSDSFFVTKRQNGTDITAQTNAWGKEDAPTGASAKILYQASNIENDGATQITGGVDWTGTANQNGDWMIYSNSATPLLKHFMRWININRQYEYDGKVHNLITTDVDNYYGGAFFTDGKGQNVYTRGIATVSGYNAGDWVIKSGSLKPDAASINGISSIYHYQNAGMWSPQHGYYTDPKAKVLITSKQLDVTLKGNKTYGAAALVGTSQTAEAGKYTVTYKGFAEGEGVADLNTANLDAMKYTDDKQQLDAGTYTKTDGFENYTVKNAADGTTADTHNYKFVYKTNLKVDKATLYYTANGTREYGDKNAAGTLTFKAIGTSADEASSVANDGNLKSWDAALKDDLTRLSGYVNSASGNMTLVSTTAAKNGATSTSTGISQKTWVNGADAANYGSYTLGKGSFLNGSTSQIVSKNYDLVYVANAKDPAVHTANLGSYTITPVDLKYNINGSHTYGGNIAASYTVAPSEPGRLKNGDKIDDLVTKKELDNLAKASIEAAGIDSKTHVKRQSNGTVTTVYDDAVGAGWINDVSAKTPNYVLKANHLRYTVNPATLTYTAADNAKTYGDTALKKTDTGSYSGFLFGENASTAYNDAVKANQTTASYTHSAKVGSVTKDIAATANADAGTYKGAVQAKGLYFNDYNVKYVSGTITIGKKDISYTVKDASKTYGDENPAFNGTFTGLVSGDTPTLGNVTYTTPANEKSGVGNYTVDASATDWGKVVNAKNYNVTVTPGKLTINPRTVTYKVNNARRQYGENDPAFSGDFTNLVNGDMIDRSSITLGTKTTNKDSDVGAYAGEIVITNPNVDWNTLLGSNYTFGGVSDGTLTIDPREVSFKINNTSKVYGNDNPTFTGVFDAGAILDKDKGRLDLTKVDYTTDAGKYSDVGSYTVKAENAANWQTILGKNYKVNYTSGTLTITPRPLTYQTGTATKTYGDGAVASAAAGAFSGFARPEDAFSATPALNAYGSTGLDKKASVGDYAMTTDPTVVKGFLSGHGNYMISEADILPGTLTVTPREVTYQVGDASRVYGDRDPAFTGSFTNMVNGDAANLGNIVYTTVSPQTGVGTYDVTASPATDWSTVLGGNYTVHSVKKGSLTITPRDVYYKADDKSRKVGDPNPTFTGTFYHGADGTGTGIMSWDISKVGTADSSAFETSVDDGTPKGVYPGVIHVRSAADAQALLDPSIAANYHFAGVLPGTMTIYSLVPAEIMTVGTSASRSYEGTHASEVHIGGYWPARKRSVARFLTVEDTGINLSAVGLDHNSVTIDSSSRADGGEKIVISGLISGTRVSGTVPRLPEDTDIAVQMTKKNGDDNTKPGELQG